MQVTWSTESQVTQNKRKLKERGNGDHAEENASPDKTKSETVGDAIHKPKVYSKAAAPALESQSFSSSLLEITA